MITLLDPGHGGKDPGCSGHDIVEADYVWGFCYALSCMSANLRLSRDRGTNLSLTGAAKVAVNVQADLSILVHCNKYKDASAKGMRLFVIEGWEHEAIWFIDYMRQGLYTSGHNSTWIPISKEDTRGYDNVYNCLAPYKKLKKPAVLMELGFLSNPDDAAFLKSAEGMMILQGTLLQAIGLTGRHHSAKTSR